jgi:hypothetical protein
MPRCATVILFAFSAIADDHATLIKQWEREDATCRGSVGGEEKIFNACDRREKIAGRIKQVGWCYGKSNQATYQYRWHECTNGSMNADGTKYEFAGKPVTSPRSMEGKAYEALLKGTWGEIGKTCKAAKDEEASFFYNGAKFVAPEQDCIVLDNSVKGETVTLNMLCVEEMGHKSKIKQNIKFIDDKTVFTNYTKYKKCS